MKTEKCIICAEEKNEGIFVKGEFICTSCEEKIVKCDLTNEEYELYLNIIRKQIVEKHLI